MSKQQVQSLKTREIVLFGLFCVSFIIVVCLQLNISLCFNMNESINQFLLQPSETSLNYTSDFINYDDINVEKDYWTWMHQLMNTLYRDHYYEGYPIPANKRFSIPNLNKVISPLRITQRRIQLIPN